MLTLKNDYFHCFGINFAADLAGLIGNDLVERAASVIQRIGYWLENDRAGYVTGDGHKWIVNSYREWVEQFPWLKPHQIGYIIRKLEAIGLLITARYSDLKHIGFRGRSPRMHPDDRSKFYRINWEVLRSLSNQEETLKPAPRANVHKCTLHRTDLYDDLQRKPNNQKHNNSVVVYDESDYSEMEETKGEESFTVVSAEIVEKMRSFGITLSTEAEAIEEDEYSLPPPSSSNQTAHPEAEKLAQEAEAQGVRMTPSLMKLIATAAANTVRDAIAALKEARRRGKIKNPTGYLTEAIKNQWQPNSDEPAVSPDELETFKRWFPIARKKGLVIASQRDGDQIMVFTADGDYVPFLEMLEKHQLYGISE